MHCTIGFFFNEQQKLRNMVLISFSFPCGIFPPPKYFPLLLLNYLIWYSPTFLLMYQGLKNKFHTEQFPETFSACTTDLLN